MDATPKRRWGWWLLLAVAVICGATYVGSFFAWRKSISVTFLVSGRFYSVRLHYFSPDPTTNRALYVFYYPLHRQKDDELRALQDSLFVAHKAENMAYQRLRRFYVRDVEMCRRAGLVGFEKK